MYRSDDGGESFHSVERSALVNRAMTMRFRAAADGDGNFFAVSDDGTVSRVIAAGEESELIMIAEKLPPAYDLVIIP